MSPVVAPNDALAALRAAMRNGHSSVPVACPHCGFDNDGEMVLDHAAAAFAPTPGAPWDACIGIYLDSACDPDDELSECPGCLEYLAADLVMLRKTVAVVA